jgi:hypothetical protein
MRTRSPRRYVRALGTACALTAVLATPAVATSGPLGLVDPANEGSLVDVTNATTAAQDNISAGNAAAISGCFSTATDPQTRPNPASPTGEEVYSVVALTSTGGTCNDTWILQRLRWNGPSTLRSLPGNAVGTGGLFEGTVAANCLAGTWHYRIKANSYHTDWVPFTCARPTDPFYIDQQ